MNYAPSRYEYRSELDWRVAMNEWLEENEPRVQYGCKMSEKQHGDPLLYSNIYSRWFWFDTPAERARFIATHPELTLLEETAQGEIQTKAQPKMKPGCPDHLDGGSMSDYRAAGYFTL